VNGARPLLESPVELAGLCRLNDAAAFAVAVANGLGGGCAVLNDDIEADTGFDTDDGWDWNWDLDPGGTLAAVGI
jgi:hypothetical protein